MRRFLSLAVAGLLMVSALAYARADAPSCGSYGTSVQFVDTPSDAAHQAKKEQKLVFVLHVSGHFEDPKLT